MPLVTDCVVAGGTLLVAMGFGLQAKEELSRYARVAEAMGLTGVAEAGKELLTVYLRIAPWPSSSFEVFHKRTAQERLDKLWLLRRLSRVGSAPYPLETLISMPQNVRDVARACARYVKAVGAVSLEGLSCCSGQPWRRS